MEKTFGRLFHESIVATSKRKTIKVSDSDVSSYFPARFIILAGCAIFLFFLLFVKLATLTLLEGGRYRGLSEGNHIREVKIGAPRAVIYDRNGTPLVRNIPEFIDPSGERFFETKPATATSVLQSSVARYYIYEQSTAHALGYTGEVTQDELKSFQNSDTYSTGGLLPGDIYGKAGIEKSYDSQIRGKAGKELLEVDALGQVVRRLGSVDPVAGRPLTLSIDIGLHLLARELLGQNKGAVVATSPKTGEVYLLYSSPSFDPNAFVTGKHLEEIFQDPNMVLFNRAIAGLYPPGSTFKIVTALAALSTGVITKETEIEDTGILQVGAFSFGNWYFSQYGKKEGMVDIVKGIKRSNDIFFYKVGELLGIDRLAAFAKRLGFGSSVGIDIPGEARGLMPDQKWMKDVRGQPWYLGNTYHVAIGQGDILATPLQVNAWTNIVANGGILCTPHLVQGKGTTCKNFNLDREIVSLVKQGMKEACSPGGTGWPLFNFKIDNAQLTVDNRNFFEAPESTISARKFVSIPTACKTGTSEFGDPKGRTHAWFTIFAPVEDPQITVTVLVEGGGEGSNIAAPIAKKILEKWFGAK